ncbi:MAG TPA: F0F1 ATP synthase subunit delta [Steroidobacteraceae bacterium]|jgi:F-type H+-transporting ATPase subunit delta|nr:F0F1 ATP synthase subunit delta [Steroidobacteraceae bacterium]
MAEPITVARPYARAAFQSASAAAALAPWDRFLSRAAVWVRDAQIEPLIGDPRVPASQLIGLLLDLAKAGVPEGSVEAATEDTAGAPARLSAAQLQEEQRNFLALLAHNARLQLLPQIAVQYEQLRAEAERIADVEVSSAQALSPAQSAALKGALERRLGRAVRLHESVDRTLLGGAVVQFGDFVVDGSLRRRVERLAANVTSG